MGQWIEFVVGQEMPPGGLPAFVPEGSQIYMCPPEDPDGHGWSDTDWYGEKVAGHDMSMPSLQNCKLRIPANWREL